MFENLTYLDALVSITVLIGFICSIVNYVLVAPINKQLCTLDASINNLTQIIDKVLNENHQFDKKLALQERTVMALHSRLDTLIEFCRDTHSNDFPHDVYCTMRRTQSSSRGDDTNEI